MRRNYGLFYKNKKWSKKIRQTKIENDGKWMGQRKYSYVPFYSSTLYFSTLDERNLN